MKKRISFWSLAIIFSLVLLCGIGMPVSAAGEATLKDGVLIQGMDVGGMTRQQATEAVEQYIDTTLKPVQLTLQTSNNMEVQVTAGDLGIRWSNPQILDEALAIGTEGNVITRYKILKDLQREPVNYALTFDFDINAINQVLTEQCTAYDQPVMNASLKRENGVFTVIEGQVGYYLDVETSIDTVYEYMTGTWDLQPGVIALNVTVQEPVSSAEDLAQVTDLLGSFTTSFSSSGADRSANVSNGCKLIDGTTLYPGEEFSTYEAVAPFTEKNGYYMAGSYLNGKVVDSLGGGICQVSTTLYNAVLLSELEVTERHNHSMIIAYVKPSMDAAIAESSGKDFRFVNSWENPIYIEGVTQGKQITFTIYGVEQRDPSHVVRYESETLSTTHPDHEIITPASGQGVGYISVESAHVGYTAQLWKIVEENGVEVSREVINKSSYKVSPRSAVVGVNTDNPVYAQRINAAVASGSIDTCKAEAAAIKAEMAAAQQQQEAAAQQQADLEAYYQALQQQQLLEQQAQLQQQILEQQAAAEQQAEP